MFPGRGPILQWGIKKGDAQSLSVQEERTTPPQRGGGAHNVRVREARSARMMATGQRKTARLAAEPGVRYPSHVNTCRLRGGLVEGLARGHERPAGRVSADDRPPAAGQRHHHTTWPHTVQGTRDEQVPEPTSRIR